MRAFFDPVSGISGDMALGALLDAGLPWPAREAELARLGVLGYRLEAGRAEQHGLTGTRIQVLLDDAAQPERHLRDIAAILDGSSLAPAVASAPWPSSGAWPWPRRMSTAPRPTRSTSTKSAAPILLSISSASWRGWRCWA